MSILREVIIICALESHGSALEAATRAVGVVRLTHVAQMKEMKLPNVVHLMHARLQREGCTSPTPSVHHTLHPSGRAKFLQEVRRPYLTNIPEIFVCYAQPSMSHGTWSAQQ